MESLKVSFDGDVSVEGITEIILKDVGYNFAGVRSEEDYEEDLKSR